MNKIGILMQLPEGKLPGFYAQIIKGIAERTELFDRDKELLIVGDEAGQKAVLEVLAKYNIPAEALPLFLVPEGAMLYPSFSDYGFTSRSERNYLYAEQAGWYRLEGGGDATQAFMQMEEHLLAVHEADGSRILAAPRQLAELLEGIARAYGCSATPSFPLR